ncbi:hypothetical protein [Deinococcus sp.]|uniref:hypothetical protein n=1 Tax=Deinococcus sp. TaxID=47478 RepID=UPI003B5CDABA
MKRWLRAVSLAAIGSLVAQAAALTTAAASSQKVTPDVARELLAPVCTTGGTTGACTPCPAFTDGHDTTFSPDTVIYGHFTDPKFTDALLDMGGCEAHVNNFGGSLLLRWQGLTNWKLIRYAQGFRTDQCLKVPAADGRDQLLCQGNYGGMGTVVENLMLLDLTKPDALTQHFFSAYDTAQACSSSGSLQHLLSWKLRPGQGRLPMLEARIKSATYTRTNDAKADDNCSGQLRATPSQIYTLTYTFDGRHFKLTPASRAALAALTRDNPDFGGDGN